MKNNQYPSNQGSITIIMVCITTMALFLIIFSDHTIAIHEHVVAQQSSTTEQAFYSAESCAEEAYLQLRTDADFVASSIDVDDVHCTVSAHPEEADAGKLVSVGTYGANIRNIVSRYGGAGPSESRSETVVYHVIDRTGSMDDDGVKCTIAVYTTAIDCEAHGGFWGSQPYTSVKVAARSFIDQMDSAYDRVGVVSYNTAQTVDYVASSDFTAAKQAIMNLPPPSDFTDIGNAIKKTTEVFSGMPADIVRAEIVLTDGRANRPLGTDPEEYARQKADEARAQGIILFTIGLGSAVNEPFLQSIASTAHGVPLYFHAPTVDDLTAIYTSIASIITTYNIDQQSWHEE